MKYNHVTLIFNIKFDLILKLITATSARESFKGYFLLIKDLHDCLSMLKIMNTDTRWRSI